jgi:hypothetical protein
MSQMMNGGGRSTVPSYELAMPPLSGQIHLLPHLCPIVLFNATPFTIDSSTPPHISFPVKY